MGECMIRKNLPIKITKFYRGKLQVFWRELFKIVRNSQPGNRFSTIPFVNCQRCEYCHERATKSQQKCIVAKVSRKLQKDKFLPGKWSICSCFVRYGLRAHTCKKLRPCFCPEVARKKDSETRIRSQHCGHTLYQDIQKPDCVQLCWCYKGSIAALLCKNSKLKARKL